MARLKQRGINSLALSGFRVVCPKRAGEALLEKLSKRGLNKVRTTAALNL
jgi:hypothetical protein